MRYGVIAANCSENLCVLSVRCFGLAGPSWPVNIGPPIGRRHKSINKEHISEFGGRGASRKVSQSVTKLSQSVAHLSGTGDSQRESGRFARINSRESFAIQTPIFIASARFARITRISDSHARFARNSHIHSQIRRPFASGMSCFLFLSFGSLLKIGAHFYACIVV